MKILTNTVAKILYAVPMGIFGLFHFMSAKAMARMVPIPGGIIWIYITGTAFIAACISILINKKAKLAALLLGIMILIFALSIHLPGAMAGKQLPMTMLLKDIALAGGAFAFSGILKD